MINNLA